MSSMNDSDKERLIRWEQARREMMGNVNTLMFAVSGASLAYCGSLIANKKNHFGCCSSWFFIFSVVFFSLSIAVNLRAAFTRLKDARYTVKIIREGDKQPDKCKSWEDLTKELGEKTWKLLRWQVGFFAGGTLCLIATLILIYGNRLFS